jgi:Rps23 Pro-64 3,4-dihydroxylase Tpa1-like proline 4-hydroxylase
MQNDRPYAATVTLYLNEDWDARDGGHFLCATGSEPDAEMMSFVPKANRLITTRRNLLHGVSRRSETAPDRITLQVFLRYRLPRGAVS